MSKARWFFWGLFFLISFSISLPARAEEKPLKVGFVDLQKALNESEAGKQAKTELEAMVKERQAIISEKAKARDKLKDELSKQSSALSEKAKRAKAEELQKLEREVEDLISESNEELQKKQREKENQILSKIEEIISKIGKEEGYAVILPLDVILYAPKDTELTERVIKIYNESLSEKEGEKK